MNNLIDTHFHLDHYKNHKKLFDLINSYKQYTLCVTNNPGVFLSCQRIYGGNKYIKFALGAHPREIKDINIIDEFRYCSSRTKYVGEVGLDFSPRYIKNKNIQIKVFNEIMNISSTQGKIVSIHSKNSEDRLIEILKKYNAKKCIIHWFGGNKNQLEELIKMGCYFSLNCNMFNIYKNYDFLKNIPLDRILIESDGPYGKVEEQRYSPEMLKDIYNIISKKLEIDKLDEIVSKNFRTILTL